MLVEIYLTKIYITNLSEYKVRLVLVIKLLDENMICLQQLITQYNSNILISINDLTDGN